MQPTYDITYVMVVYGKLLIRMNNKTGRTWAFEKGVWLPIKEEK